MSVAELAHHDTRLLTDPLETPQLRTLYNASETNIGNYDREIFITELPGGAHNLHVSNYRARDPEAQELFFSCIKPDELMDDPSLRAQQDNALHDLSNETIQAIVNYAECGRKGQSILTALGYEIDDQMDKHTIGSGSITLPGLDRINRFLSFVEKRTGFALGAQDFDGAEFPFDVQQEELEENTLLVSDKLGVREHDLSVHLPVWVTLPKEVIAAMTARYAAGHDSVYEYADYTLDSALFAQLTRDTEDDDPRATSRLTGALRDILLSNEFDDSPSFEDQSNLFELVYKTHQRVDAVAALADDFNRLSIAT